MNLPLCQLCRREISERETPLRQVVGWLRPQGTGGGQVVKREDTGLFAHRACVEHGVPEGRLL